MIMPVVPDEAQLGPQVHTHSENGGQGPKRRLGLVGQDPPGSTTTYSCTWIVCGKIPFSCFLFACACECGAIVRLCVPSSGDVSRFLSPLSSPLSRLQREACTMHERVRDQQRERQRVSVRRSARPLGRGVGVEECVWGVWVSDAIRPPRNCTCGCARCSCCCDCGPCEGFYGWCRGSAKAQRARHVRAGHVRSGDLVLVLQCIGAPASCVRGAT